MQKLVHGLTNLPFSGIIHSNLTQETEVFDDMNTAYGVVTEIYGLEGETRCPAEITAYANADADGTASIVASVMDISSNETQVKAFVGRCDPERLPVCSFQNKANDFLAGNV